jgi:hypothetical protein
MTNLYRIAAYFNEYAQTNIFALLSPTPDHALFLLRHCSTILGELSTAKENSFKNADWPVQLLKMPSVSPGHTLMIRKRTLQLIAKVLHHFSSDCLMHLAEVISSYFTELGSVSMDHQEALILGYLRQLCSVGFKLNNLVPLDRRNFALFCNYIGNYYSIGFESVLHDNLITKYQQDNSKAEEILGVGISWIKGLLDNPGIWVSDLVYSDRDADSTGEAESYLEKTFFTKERIHHILRVILTKYLTITREEVTHWEKDSLQFFLYLKENSNEIRGNFLREKAKSLIAGIQLRFGGHFDSFCAIIIGELAASTGLAEITLE